MIWLFIYGWGSYICISMVTASTILINPTHSRHDDCGQFDGSPEITITTLEPEYQLLLYLNTSPHLHTSLAAPEKSSLVSYFSTDTHIRMIKQKESRILQAQDTQDDTGCWAEKLSEIYYSESCKFECTRKGVTQFELKQLLLVSTSFQSFSWSNNKE